MAKKSKNNDATWYSLAVARIGLGLILLWAFVDKLFGLGFSTCRDAKTHVVTTMCSKAWVHGGSPTDGFLKFASKGPLHGFYSSLAGNKFVAFSFMAGLLLIGLALVTGIGIRIATLAGSVLFLMMWSAVLSPENNPVLDEHLIYIAILMAIMFSNDNQKLGLGSWWAKQGIVQKIPILK